MLCIANKSAAITFAAIALLLGSSSRLQARCLRKATWSSRVATRFIAARRVMTFITGTSATFPKGVSRWPNYLFTLNPVM